MVHNPHSASDRYADMQFRNSLSGVSMSQPHHVEFPKFARAFDGEGKMIAEKMVHSAKEELAFLQSIDAQPVPTKAEEENASLTATIAKLMAEIEALKAQAPAPVAPEVAVKAELADKVARLRAKHMPEAGE